MPYRFFLQFGDKTGIRGTVSSGALREGWAAVASELKEQATDEEIDGAVKLEIKLIGGENKSARVAAPPPRAKKDGTAPATGSAGVAAQQAATRPEKGKTSRK